MEKSSRSVIQSTRCSQRSVDLDPYLVYGALRRDVNHLENLYSTGVFHFFARSKEVVKYREKSGKRREHESQEEHTAAE
jgi:hypothetical protein